jgi:hypothetical protein
MTQKRNKVIHSEARELISKASVVRSRQLTACADKAVSVLDEYIPIW